MLPRGTEVCDSSGGYTQHDLIGTRLAYPRLLTCTLQPGMSPRSEQSLGA